MKQKLIAAIITAGLLLGASLLAPGSAQAASGQQPWTFFQQRTHHQATVTAAARFNAATSAIDVRITYASSSKSRHTTQIRAVEVVINGRSRTLRTIEPSAAGEITLSVATASLSAAERAKPLSIQANIYEHFDSHPRRHRTNKPLATSPAAVVVLPARHITSTPQQVAIEGFAGTARTGSVQLTATEKINHVTYTISGQAARMASIDTSGESTIEAGTPTTLSLLAAIPSQKSAGTYPGLIEIRESGKQIAAIPLVVTVSTATATIIPADTASPTPDQIVQDPATPFRLVKDEIFVGLSLTLSTADQRIKAIAAQTGAVIIGALPDMHMYQLRYPGITLTGLNAKRDQLAALADVSFASHNLESTPSALPNDQGYITSPTEATKSPWEDTFGNPRTWGQRYIKLPEAWNTTTGSAATRIGVIDTAFEPAHPDLTANVAATIGANLPSRAYDALYKKDHGTKVAGTICAEGNNTIGIAGVNWRCSLGLYDGRVASPASMFETDVVRMMHQATLDNMRVVNLSYGWGDQPELCKQTFDIFTKGKIAGANNAIREAIYWTKSARKDILWVFAAGNSCHDVAEVAPAALAAEFPQNVMAVAAINYTNNMAGDATKLYESNGGSGVSVAAPGQYIYTTAREGSYASASGTSMAAPLVSGLAGLVLSAHTDYTAEKVKQCIVQAANASGHAVTGHAFKVINAPEAIKCAAPPPPVTPPPPAAAPCIFELANRPQVCSSTNPVVQVNFANVAGSAACIFESHLTWIYRDPASEQIDTISNLAVNAVKPLGTYTFTTPGEHAITHTVKPLTSGPCTILPSLYIFRLLP